MRIPHRKLVLVTCTLGVLGAGFAGVAAAQTIPATRPTARPVELAPAARHRPPRPTRTAIPTSPAATSPTPTSPATTDPATPAPTTPAPSTPAPSTPAPTTPVPTTAAPTVPPPDDTVIGQVLAHINAARTQNGLVALTLSADLSRASELHNQLMIGGCGLSHQCPGEASLGDRFTAQGVRWTSAGENIGYGSAGSSQTAIVGAANGLTDSMLAEVAPNDGHRRNLLNTGFRQIGLAVDRDAKGLVWMTQDFVN